MSSRDFAIRWGLVVGVLTAGVTSSTVAFADAEEGAPAAPGVVGTSSGAASTASAAGPAGLPGAPAPRADGATFEALVRGAEPISGEAELAALLWPTVATCDGDELTRRQCEAVKAARRSRALATTFVVDADASALAIGGWDAGAQAVPVALRGCVACARPVTSGGRALFVVASNATPVVDGDAVRAATIHDGRWAVADEAAAATWRAEVVPRLRTQLIVRLAAGGQPWQLGDRGGLAVDVLGFRVHDPCDGTIVAASPAATRATVDTANPACADRLAAVRLAAQSVMAAKALPSALRPADIQKALRPAQDAAQACFDTYGVPGSSTLHITIAASGAVIALDQDGDFSDTPTGACIDKAVRATTFPPTTKPRTTITYPFILR